MLKQQNDPYDLDRFVKAQAASYPQALGELRAGRKKSHWNWYVLPQLHSLGSSPMSIRYAIKSLAEAKAYLEHPLLGARLRECVTAMNSHTEVSAGEILGEIDAQKFRSCLTLFAQVAGSEPLFGDALKQYFAGESDATTVALLAGGYGARGEGR